MSLLFNPIAFKQPQKPVRNVDSIAEHNPKTRFGGLPTTRNSAISQNKQRLTLLELWHINYTTRRRLRQLDDTLLYDIGLDRAAALREAKKPFWRK